MKKVIEGLLYDTDTAKLIISEVDESGEIIKRLYQTTKSAFFFYYISSGTIEPISRDACREWLGLYNYNAYVSVFGEPEHA